MLNERFLYRAKHKTNAVWELGSLVILPNGDYEIANKCANPPDSDPMWKKCVITHMVDPSTICQATGLHDATRWEELTCEEQRQFLSSDNVRENRKNQESDWQGKLIFEGDILAAYLDDDNPDDVTYAGVVWARNAWCIQEAGSLDLHLLDQDVEKDYKIVGTVFDNPDLMEVKA